MRTWCGAELNNLSCLERYSNLATDVPINIGSHDDSRLYQSLVSCNDSTLEFPVKLCIVSYNNEMINRPAHGIRLKVKAIVLVNIKYNIPTSMPNGAALIISMGKWMTSSEDILQYQINLTR